MLKAPTLGAGLSIPRLTDKIGLKFALDAIVAGASINQTVGLEDGKPGAASAKAVCLGGEFVYKWKKDMDLRGTYDLNYAAIDFGPSVAGNMRGHTGTDVSRTDIFHTVTFGSRRGSSVVTVTVTVIDAVAVAALVNGNDAVGVVDAVNDHHERLMGLLAPIVAGASGLGLGLGGKRIDSDQLRLCDRHRRQPALPSVIGDFGASCHRTRARIAYRCSFLSFASARHRARGARRPATRARPARARCPGACAFSSALRACANRGQDSCAPRDVHRAERGRWARARARPGVVHARAARALRGAAARAHGAGR